MIGQSKLLAKINSYSVTTFPHTVLFVGDFGCGKHLLATEIAKKFNFDILDITEKITLDFLEEIKLKVMPTVYIIDLTKLTDKQQNVILKFTEEPVDSAYIIMLAENKLNVIGTLLNRCVMFEFAPYTAQELAKFIEPGDLNNSKDILRVCKTPGQIKITNANNLKQLQQDCETIINNVDKVNYPSIISFSKRINFKDEYDKYNINIFFNVFIDTLYQTYLQTKSNKVLSYYKLTINYLKRLRDSRLNKELFMENYLSALWQESRAGKWN